MFALKKNQHGAVIRFKDRLVAKGFYQRHGVDYHETYSLVANLNSIRAALATLCARGMEIDQCDVDTAFLYGELEGTIFMELPDGYDVVLSDQYGVASDGNVVCKLNRSVYGMKQASRVWPATIDSYLKELGFVPTDADPCIYTRGNGAAQSILCLCVDDLLIASCLQSVIDDVKSDIKRRFKLKDLVKAEFILGIQIEYQKECKTLRISQKSYFDEVIRRFGQETAKPSLVSLDVSSPFSASDMVSTAEDRVTMEGKPYRALVGSLMYLSTGTVLAKNT